MCNKEFFEEIEHYVDKVRDDAYEDGYIEANKDKQFDPYGQQNINFSIELREDDERREKHKKQRMERGFDDTELWNLDCTILKFILPRLKAFKEATFGAPGEMTYEEWLDVIQKMIDSIEKILSDTSLLDLKDEDYDGWELFKKYFFHLWW